MSILVLGIGCKEAPEEAQETQEGEENQEATSPGESEETPETPSLGSPTASGELPSTVNTPSPHGTEVAANTPNGDPSQVDQAQDPAHGPHAATDPTGDPTDQGPSNSQEEAAAGEVLLSLGQVSAGTTGLERTVGVVMTTSADVAGFQFLVEGATLTGSGGGTAAQNGFSVSTSGGGGVVGVSFSGTLIPVGGSVLTELTFVPEPGAAELCLSGAVIANPQGESLPVRSGACAPL